MYKTRFECGNQTVKQIITSSVHSFSTVRTDQFLPLFTVKAKDITLKLD